MSEPMTTPEDQKAAQCPSCESDPFRSVCAGIQLARCSNTNCGFSYFSIPLSQWNTRPRETALEGVLRELKSFVGEVSLDRVSYWAKNTMSGDSEEIETDQPTKRAIRADALLSAINAALEEKR